MRQTILLVQPIEVIDFLFSVHLEREALRAALLFGEHRRDSCTPNHPSIYPSIAAWAESSRKLRDDLPTKIWTKVERPIPGILNASKRMLLAVAGGDENTGAASRTPKTSRAMGNAIIEAAYRNRLGVLDLKFANSDESITQPPLVWFLLRHRRGNRIVAELSIPDAIGNDRKIIGWAQRVILDPIDLDPSPHPARDDEPQDFDPQVTRKAS